MEKPPTTPLVRGQIVDKDASPIIGATIIVDGTTKGIVSDENGFFELDLSQFKNKSITLNIGYLEKESKSVDVKIKDLPKSLGQIKLKDGVYK
ncbi:carboxypeptidase-like regulatory domain-containing protein [Algoriphagus halophytocola]|uniref:Carboxypeptidase-like regulatory domain-containing protein n=1 Tax=Algoriphagus halophytocola TaxID=2991499 RepID=A0ABY6MD24_9BACT|nr:MULTISPECIES: carboxypeptidase-like regulatory domain-containing protein [unclassified Algoriphagus]UZD21013.1 carboxypeptidase-like regulatory domain-containing protein [Algoriphagus sp. TR-M5]WBL42179.1 carboxypeptidase-like regulatory domain-containing protein [Algoriphagus sp. TR-M9]